MLLCGGECLPHHPTRSPAHGGRVGLPGGRAWRRVRMATAVEVTAWMQAEFERAGELAQADAVAGVRARFGPGFATGGRIRKDALDALRQLEPAGRVFVGSRKVWRRRNLHDPPPHGAAGP